MAAISISRLIISAVAGLCLFSCKTSTDTTTPTIGSFERIDSAINNIIAADASIEIIADSLDWSEGPVWVESQKMLLFSDIPVNRIYKWTAAGGKQLYLEPAGYTSKTPRGGEIGSNGLALDSSGRLTLCQHGDRRIAVMNAPIESPRPEFISLADNYQGKKFDSPNDLVYDQRGNIYFTDPPYGLEKNVDDPNKQAPYQGVYRVINGKVELLVDSITRPNGIAFTPDFKTLMVANSDEKNPYLYAFDIGANDSIQNPRRFIDLAKEGFSKKGGADGFKIDSKGNIYTTAPGGVWIYDKNAKLLGRILVPEFTSNVAFADDEKTLFITADRYVLRVSLRK